MAELNLDEKSFDEVIKGDKPVLVDFWATWCGPCQMMGPIVAEIADEHPEIVVGKVNVDDVEALAYRYHVSSIPTLILFKNGEMVNKSVGAIPKAQLEAFIKS